jgi:hypothetical protein
MDAASLSTPLLWHYLEHVIGEEQQTCTAAVHAFESRKNKTSSLSSTRLIHGS